MSSPIVAVIFAVPTLTGLIVLLFVINTTPELSDTYVNVPLLVDVAYGMKGEDVIEIVVFTNPCPVIVGVPFVIVKTAEISL